MGKHGPCRHCGVTSTPLWRNGPPEKPVLCNACGSRWRTKGSLINYTPLHSRELIETHEVKITKVKSITFKHKDQKSPQQKLSNGIVEYEHEILHPEKTSRKILEEDYSNRSSSESAVSYSGSCAYFGNIDTNDFTGSAQSNIWDSLVPSRKRTGNTRPKTSPVEKLTKDLHLILHEQQSSHLSCSSENDLLYESETPWDSIEIGHGGVLIRQINTKTIEEESEASSLPVNNQSYIVNEACSGSVTGFLHSVRKEASSINACIEKHKATDQPAHQHIRRDKHSNEQFGVLHDGDSPLSSADLREIVNMEVFFKVFTNEEQKLLMTFLPSLDTAKPPDSCQFLKATSYFQQLLLSGIFHPRSFSEPENEDFRSLRKLILRNLSNCEWVEPYIKLKDAKFKELAQGRGTRTESNYVAGSTLAALKRPRDSENQSFSDAKGNSRSPILSERDPPLKKIHIGESSNSGSESNHDPDELIDNEESSFSPRGIFMLPLHQTDDSSEQVLLLEAPCNAPIPEAELLHHPWKQITVPSSSVAVSEVAEGEESRSNFPTSHDQQTRLPVM